ncbi:MAG: PAS domain-containing protein [Rhodospirillaceae bacterium]|jgi:hypothetical protein|nr:PAS domain-containing protein [Rhodospirillaceae bacterium]MBT4487488.1 PAS domain-containing protein [Rhodospirillaceae bacterium]MBT5194642.1 PAS domain-containing protein [Rhodospirillaceae bacterium]MBT5898723.1 PAS domain-containing protein [Rhodospirillaceae bacterium]MBT6429289.1 PAS domain-containing protein [Rhodospirillaceae bacterium]
MAVSIISTSLPLSEAPDAFKDLTESWRALSGARKYPSRRDIRPENLRAYLGYICILEVKHEPPDFVYRLYGSGIADYLQQDLTGMSVRELRPAELGQSIIDQIQDTIQSGMPVHYRVEVIYGRTLRRSTSYRLTLPLSDDDQIVSQVMTYSRFDAAHRDIWSNFPD